MSAAIKGGQRVLIASADVDLSELRKQVIEQQPSLEVAVSRNKQHALALLHRESFDLLILCNSLTVRTQVEFTAIYRQKNPKGKILAIAVRGAADLPCDAVLPAPVSPCELLGAVRHLLRLGGGDS